jgi:predicted RNA-binding Zn-ribbon protein involved in translation (DUF1610 family)
MCSPSMTRTNALGRAVYSGGKTAGSQRRKALLICPNCGHESATDGDWVVTLGETTADLSCPGCRTCLTTRWLGE